MLDKKSSSIYLLNCDWRCRAWNQEQLIFLADNTLQVEERDKAVKHVLQSTLHLNQLFKDVAYLVAEQVEA